MRYKMQSHLRPYIEGVVEQKRALGFDYSSGELILGQFDKYCFDNFPNEKTITKKMGLGWAEIRSTESGRGHAGRLPPVRELARFMVRKGIDAYIVPDGIAMAPGTRILPHIFTESELQAVFEQSDCLVPTARDNTRHLVIPVLLRLLYCCGLRPNEGRLLIRKNVDLEQGVITLIESKGHKDRLVVMSESMRLLCKKYSEAMDRLVPDREYFFPSARLPVFDRHVVSHALQRCWSDAGYEMQRCPRPYDFRHTFATKTLYRWLEEGRDLDNCLPYLSAYMGHSKFEHTAYYIHLVPEFFPQMAKMDLNRFAAGIPEVEG